MFGVGWGTHTCAEGWKAVWVSHLSVLPLSDLTCNLGDIKNQFKELGGARGSLHEKRHQPRHYTGWVGISMVTWPWESHLGLFLSEPWLLTYNVWDYSKLQTWPQSLQHLLSKIGSICPPLESYMLTKHVRSDRACSKPRLALLEACPAATSTSWVRPAGGREPRTLTPVEAI